MGASHSRRSRKATRCRISQDAPYTMKYRPGTLWNGGVRSYRNFPVLETLVLAAVNFFPDLDDHLADNAFGIELDEEDEVGGSESQIERDARYVDLIPPSLRFFKVTGPSPFGSCMKLAAETAEGRFPELKAVRFEAISDGEEILVEAAFAAAKIKCMIGYHDELPIIEFNNDLHGSV